MESSVLQQITAQDNIPLRLFITLLENTVEIILLQDENAWKCIVIKDKLHNFADEYKMSVENYCSKLLDYIKNAYPNILYIFKDNEFAINRVLENSLMVKYFSCKMEKTDYVEHVEQIMDKLYLENSRFCDDLIALQKEKEELIRNKNDCESKLALLADKKNTDENEHLGHFISVLNEKKRRIQHLTELLEAFKNGRPTSNPVVKITSRNRSKEVKNSIPIQKRETISASESSDTENYNTDTDSGSNLEEHSTTSTKGVANEESQPSTSSVFLDILEDKFEGSHILPKRIKRTEANDVIVAPVALKSPPKTPESTVSKSKRSKSPEIDLSTQQLLDLL